MTRTVFLSSRVTLHFDLKTIAFGMMLRVYPVRAYVFVGPLVLEFEIGR